MHAPESPRDLDSSFSEPWSFGAEESVDDVDDLRRSMSTPAENSEDDGKHGLAHVKGTAFDKLTDDDDEDVDVGEKRKGKEPESQQKKRVKGEPDEKPVEKRTTGPRPGKSIPAVSAPKKRTHAIDKFAEIAAKEEATTQKVIELKTTKAQGYNEKQIAKVKAQADVQMNKDRLKAELAAKTLALEEKKLEWEYRLKIAQMNVQHHPPAAPAPTLSAHHAPTQPMTTSVPNETLNGNVNSYTSGGNWMQVEPSSSGSRLSFTEQLKSD